MEATIQPALPSPRVEDSVLKWYIGDCFNISWTIALTEDEKPLPYKPEDKLIFSFFTTDRKQIVEFTFTNIQENTVLLVFDEKVSKKFLPGKYVYCIKYEGEDGRVTTLYANRKIEVLPCH